MKKILFALITTATALTGVSAHAADVGAYAGVGLVGTHDKFNVPGAVGGDDSTTKGKGKLFSGYNIDKTWGVEAGYTDFGSASRDYTVNGVGGHIESDAHSFYLAGKGSWPVNEQFSVFGKLGAARNHNSVEATGAAAGLGGSGNKTALYASIGGEYAINKQVSATLEYEHYGKNDNDFGRKQGAITAAVAYHF